MKSVSTKSIFAMQRYLHRLFNAAQRQKRFKKKNIKNIFKLKRYFKYETKTTSRWWQVTVNEHIYIESLIQQIISNS